MKTFLIILFIFIISQNVIGQNNLLNIKVYRKSHEIILPLQGVEIYSNNAHPKISDDNGFFTLSFYKVLPGQEVHLFIHYKDDWDIINLTDTITKLPESNKDTLLLFLCPKNQLTRERILYYIQKDIILQYENKLTSLESNNDEIIKNLSNERDILLIKVNEFADKYGYTDFKDVSPILYSATNYLKIGKIDSAIITLENAQIKQNLKKLIETENKQTKALEETKKNKISLIKSNIALGDFYQNKFEFDSAEYCYELAFLADTTNLVNLILFSNLLLQQKDYEKLKYYSLMGLRISTSPSLKDELIYKYTTSFFNLLLSLTYHINGENETSHKYANEADKLSETIQLSSFNYVDFAKLKILIYSILGSFWQDKNDYEMSELYYTQQLIIVNSLNDAEKRISLSDVYLNFSYLYTKQQNYKKALLYDSLALTTCINNSIIDDNKLANIYSRTATNNFQYHNFNEGEQYLKKAIEIYQKLTDKNFFAYGMSLASSYGLLAHQYDLSNIDSIALLYENKALEILQTIYAKYPTNFNKESLALTYSRLALYSKNDKTVCDSLFLKSINFYHELINSNKNIYCLDLARVYYHYSQVFYIRMDYKFTEEYLLRSLQTVSSDTSLGAKEYFDFITDLYSSLGILYSNMNNFDKANKYLTQALKYINDSPESNLPDHKIKYADINFELGVLYYNVNYYIANNYLLKSLAIYDSLAKAVPKLYLTMLSTIYSYLGKLDHINNKPMSAKSYIEKAIGIDNQLANSHLLRDSSALASNYLTLGVIQDSEKPIWHAIDIFNNYIKVDSGLYKHFIAEAYLSLALVLSQKNQLKSAEQYLIKAEQIFVSYYQSNPSVFREKLAVCCTRLGFFYESIDRVKSIQYFERSLNLINQFSPAYLQARYEDLASINYQLGKLYFNSNQEKSEECLKKSIELNNKLIQKSNPAKHFANLAISSNLLGKLFLFVNKTAESITYFKNSCDVFNNFGDSIPIVNKPYWVDGMLYLGFHNLFMNETKVSDYYFSKAYSIYQMIPDSIIAKNVQLNADISLGFGDYFTNILDSTNAIRFLKSARNGYLIASMDNPLYKLNFSTASFKLGNLYMNINNVSEARNYLNEALVTRKSIKDNPNIYPLIAECLLSLGIVYLRSDNIDSSKVNLLKAYKYYNSFSEVPSFEFNIAESSMQLGFAYYYKNQYDSSKYYLNKSLMINKKHLTDAPLIVKPKISDIYSFYGFIDNSEKKYVDAEYYLTQAIELVRVLPNINQFLRKWYDIIFFYQNHQSFEKAIKYAEELVYYEPKDSYAWKTAAFLYRESKNYIKALKYYKKAIKIKPESEYYISRAFAYIKLGRLEKSKDDLVEATRLGIPGNFWYFIYWACYYSSMKNKVDALTNIQKAIDSGFTDIQWLKDESSLEFLHNTNEFVLLLQKNRK